MKQGEAVPQLVAAPDFSLSTPKQIVIAGDPAGFDRAPLTKEDGPTSRPFALASSYKTTSGLALSQDAR